MGQYRIYCVDEDTCFWVDGPREGPAPTECPNDAGHDIDEDETAYDPSKGPALRIERFLTDAQRAALRSGFLDVRGLDYKSELIGRLHKSIEIKHRGEYRTFKYWVDPTESELVLQVDDVYWRRPNGLLYRYTGKPFGDPEWYGRRKTRRWVREDGTFHPDVKVTYKEYDFDMDMKEGRTRRQNLIDNMTIAVLQLLTATETAGDVDAAEDIGKAYLAKYESDITTYLRSGDLSWKTKIINDNETWLDNDIEPLGFPAGTIIKDYILDSLKGIMEA